MTRHRKILLGSLASVLILGLGAWMIRSSKGPGGSASGGIFQGAFGGTRKREVVVALLARQAGPLTDLHEICLGRFFDELNQQRKDAAECKFVLRTYDLETLRKAHGDLPPYEALMKENSRLAAVIDNTWGSDLQKSREPVKTLGVPVISLNADRNGDYGDTVLFLGSGNMVSAKVASFVSKALADSPDPDAKPVLAFLTENGYGARQAVDTPGGFRYFYEDEIEKAKLRFDKKISFDEKAFADLGERSRIDQELKKALALGGNRPVVVVVNAHKDWGSHLVALLEDGAAENPDRSFRAIGNDTIFDQAKHDAERSDTAGTRKPMDFEMILLKTPNPEYSTRTFDVYQRILADHPDLINLPEAPRTEPGKYGEFPGFPKEVASIFIWRCAVAAELLRDGYRNLDERERVEKFGTVPGWEFKSREDKDRILLGDVFRRIHMGARVSWKSILADTEERLKKVDEDLGAARVTVPVELPTNPALVQPAGTSYADVLEERRTKAGAAFRELKELAREATEIGAVVGDSDLEGLGEEASKIVKANQGTHLELGDLGLVHFNAYGEEDGSHYFELHKNGSKPMAHLKQLNAENELIPALQIGINEFQIRRVDVERGEFDAEFICSTTISSSLKTRVLDVLEALRKKERDRERFPEDESVTGDPRGKLVQYPMLSGLLSIPNMRADGSVAQIGQTDRSVEDTEYRVYKVRGTFAADLDTVRYPFDSHQIGVELQAAVPDQLLTLTAQRVESAAWEENQRGWIVKWIHGLVDNRVANGNPLAGSSQRHETHQFKEFAIMVGVLRDIRQPMLVVMLPLILLGAAAIGIMFLGEKETMGKSPSELAMGVVLGVVAYSISYADVVPRSGGGTYSDHLYLFTILICMGNFGAVLVFGELGNTKTRNDPADQWRFRYSILISIIYIGYLIHWLGGGLPSG